jgi:hypothetical protein
MFKILKNKLYLLPIAFFLIAYLLWLYRAYYDVAYMDQIQILAGNMKNMLNHDASFHDFYYRPPFLLLVSNVLVYINCKLFAYNTFLENITSGLILAVIAYYFCKSNLAFFGKWFKLCFSFIASFIIFCFTKWELSLWGGGFSHYMVVLFGFICVGSSHKYYFSQENQGFVNKYYLPLYLGLSVISIMETTSYFLPFQIALLIQLLLNYKLFREKINNKRWKTVLYTTAGLVIFSLIFNYLFEVYSIKHPYESYGKTNLGSTLGPSLKKVFTEPIWAIKFFLIANAGNLIAKDYYPITSYMLDLMPLFGLVLLTLYGYSIYLFIKLKKIEGIFSINLIMSTIIFYGTMSAGRMGLNDVFYGGSSRYSAFSFAGTLGIATFFLLLLQHHKKLKTSQKALFAFPVLFIFILNLITDKNEWKLAPYRKVAYANMADSLRLNQNLNSLQGYNAQIAGEARTVMIRNKLNVFKPETKLDTYTLNCEDARGLGIYETERNEQGSFRWTNGNGIILLPNLYTITDTIKLRVKCYSPQADSLTVILNDNLKPFHSNKMNDGFEYIYAFDEQKVIFKATLINRIYKPRQLDSTNADKRTLGIVFSSLTLSNYK